MEALIRADAHVYEHDGEPSELVKECLEEVGEKCGVPVSLGKIEKKKIASSVAGTKDRFIGQSNLSSVYWFSFTVPIEYGDEKIDRCVREELRDLEREDIKFQKVRTLGHLD